MNKGLKQTMKNLAMPIAFAVISGVVVAFLTGALSLTKIKKWVDIQPLIAKVLPVAKSAGISGGGDNYVAVFLNNGQVYFGKLSGANTESPVLTDVYYLRVQRNLQPDETDTGGDKKTSGVRQSQPITDFKLIKLGKELHSPEDKVELNREYILFWEKLREDSKVVTAIEVYQKQQEE